MDDSKQIALLKEENSRLREENEVLFKTVDQMRNSINLLVSRFIVNSANR